MNTSAYAYHPASMDELDRIWAKNIADNPGDGRWVTWRNEFIADNAARKCKTFVVCYHGEPIGEGTLLFTPEAGGINGRLELADGANTVNLGALRMDKRHEGKGHISKLVKLMEQYAREQGYKQITIGVEPKETRNFAIYLHWGYDTFIRADHEDDGLILYYCKTL